MTNFNSVSLNDLIMQLCEKRQQQVERVEGGGGGSPEGRQDRKYRGIGPAVTHEISLINSLSLLVFCSFYVLQPHLLFPSASFSLKY